MILSRIAVFFWVMGSFVSNGIVASFKPAIILHRAYSVNSFYCQKRYVTNTKPFLQKLTNLLNPKLPVLQQPPKVNIPQSILPDIEDPHADSLQEALHRAEMHSKKGLTELIKDYDKTVPYTYKRADK